MTAREIADVFEQIAPIDSGVPADELGFVYGSADMEVGAVGCAWCVQTASIERAADIGVNLLIAHEALWLPPQDSPWYEAPAPDRLLPRIKRTELLDRHGITVYRSHSNWDALRNDGIADSALAALGFDDLREVARRKFFSVQELPAPMNVAEIGRRVEKSLGFTGCRVFGDPAKRIRRFAFLVGGFGENQLHLPQVAMELGAEAVIIGEMSEFIVIGCLDMGLPVIETLHSVSEMPGIRNQARVLGERLPEIPVHFISSGAGTAYSGQPTRRRD